MDRENYYKSLGWKKSPFIKSTSIDIPIISRVEEYTTIIESIGGWDRIIILTAPIGYGKTTFMNQLMMEPPKSIRYIVSFNAPEPVEQVMDRIINSFSFFKRGFKKPDQTGFGEYLQKRLGRDKMLLIFDEAQDYDADLFKWLRMLNDRCDNLFMIFLGLSDLDDKISAVTSFRDRKSKSLKLNSFNLEDLEELVKARIYWAGGVEYKPFTEKGIKRLCESSNHVPRLLLENAQRVIEECSKKEIYSVDDDLVEFILGAVPKPVKIEKKKTEKESTQPPSTYNFLDDLSPTQRDIIKLLLKHEGLSISELSETLKKDIRSLGSLIRKLRGLNKSEVKRKPKVPYPVVIRSGKEIRMGRSQYVYSLSDNSRRILSKS